MALTVGQCLTDPVTGMAGAVFNAMVARGATALGFAPGAFTAGTPARASLAALVETICTGIVQSIVSDAVVTTNVSGGGLQRYDDDGVTKDTEGPLTTQQLGGSIS